MMVNKINFQMVFGRFGRFGLFAPKHVALELNTEQETVNPSCHSTVACVLALAMKVLHVRQTPPGASQVQQAAL